MYSVSEFMAVVLLVFFILLLNIGLIAVNIWIWLGMVGLVALSVGLVAGYNRITTGKWLP